MRQSRVLILALCAFRLLPGSSFADNTTNWISTPNTTANWSDASKWTLGEPTAVMDAFISSSDNTSVIQITEEGEACQNLLFCSGVFSYASVTMLSGSLTTFTEQLGPNGGFVKFIQQGGINTTHDLFIGLYSQVKMSGGTLHLNDGFACRGTLDLTSSPVTITADSAIVNLTLGQTVNAAQASLTVGPDSLVLYNPGQHPATVFKQFASQGIVHEVGQTLIVGSDQTLRGWGSIADPVECSGTIAAAPGGYIFMNTSVKITDQATVDAGTGTIRFSRGTSYLTKTVNTGYEYVGNDPDVGSVIQSSGTNTCWTLCVFSGNYDLNAGSLTIPKAIPQIPGALPRSPTHRGIFIAYPGSGTGNAVFHFGNADGTGTLVESGQGDAADLGIGELQNDITSFFVYPGSFQGWGTVGFTGRLVNQGRVVADGYGTDRALDLSSLTSVVSNASSHASGLGWFVQNQGKLVLPVVSVSSGRNTYNWGERPYKASAVPPAHAYTRLDLVNSLQIAFDNVTAPGTLSGTLLATDRTDLPVLPERWKFIGLWNLAKSDNLTFTTANLMFRYDDNLTRALTLTESLLHVLGYDGQQWIDITSSIDTTNHWIYSNAVTAFSYFAVGAILPCRLTGTVVLGDYVGTSTPPTTVPVMVELRGSQVTDLTVYLDPDGGFTIPNVAPGTYDIWIKPSHWLSQVQRAVPIRADTNLGTFSFLNGDANGDNQVSFEDFSALQNNYGQSGKTSDQGDFNGDGCVTYEDFSILQNAYGQSGDSGAGPLSAAAAMTTSAIAGCGSLGITVMVFLALSSLALRFRD